MLAIQQRVVRRAPPPYLREAQSWPASFSVPGERVHGFCQSLNRRTHTDRSADRKVQTPLAAARDDRTFECSPKPFQYDCVHDQSYRHIRKTFAGANETIVHVYPTSNPFGEMLKYAGSELFASWLFGGYVELVPALLHAKSAFAGALATTRTDWSAPMRRTRLCAILIAFFLPSLAIANDHFLTIGGGYSPHGNQVSLEKNVVFFKKVLAEKYTDGVQHDVIFSDGDNNDRDLQYYDPHQPVPEVHQLLGRIFQSTKNLEYQYRNHQVENLYGNSSRTTIEHWFGDVGSHLTRDDRLFIYVTAHGGKGDRKDVHNTGLYLWNRQRINMKDFVAQLDKVPTEVPVVLVMVQCYSGGFADIIFNGGDRKKGVSSANRCGFYATVHDRPAAGCTPDINEENYQEYSSFFWAAIRGKSRVDDPIESADYDTDGKITLEEAHAFALIHSSTIDISVKTSEEFLRVVSKTGDGKNELLTATTPYERLMENASVCERTVLDRLSDALGLAKSDRDNEAQTKAYEISKEKKKHSDAQMQKSSEYAGLAKQIAASIIQRWPEMSNRWHPNVSKIIAEEEAEVVKAIRSHPRFKLFEQLALEINQLGEKTFNLDRDWVKCQRIRRLLTNVALAANLDRVADHETQQRFKAMVLAERQVLGRQATAPSAAVAVAAQD